MAIQKSGHCRWKSAAFMQMYHKIQTLQNVTLGEPPFWLFFAWHTKAAGAFVCHVKNGDLLEWRFVMCEPHSQWGEILSFFNQKESHQFIIYSYEIWFFKIWTKIHTHHLEWLELVD